jgi:hypothetical protein
MNSDWKNVYNTMNTIDGVKTFENSSVKKNRDWNYSTTFYEKGGVL